MALLLEEPELTELVAHYEPEPDDAARARWRQLFDAQASGPIVLVNRFAFRDAAAYEDGRSASGQAAFAAYAAVSVPTLARLGGRFLASSPPVVGLFGAGPEADLVVVGWYPDRAALLGLLRDPEYREAFAHRRAALAVDEVVVLGAP